ncbi:unnamed protein product [Anisakis simplex]|uniref:acid phosphatase n=1 Tax=Anisakis simplex TaxID=6269 RepID=A0A0M3KB34_ANISI|nr:unnamed protein product [Anisakis simplex]
MAIDFNDGINLSTCDGLNLHVLIPQVRGGPMLWDIIHRIDFKHDDTLAALLAALGAKHKLLPHGYPEYASAVIIELWNTKKGPQIKMKYHRNSNEVGFEDATSAIQGCSLEQGYCSYADFKKRSEPYNPKNITKLCDDVPGNYEKKKRDYVMNRNQEIHWMVENDADKMDPNEKPFNDFSPKFAVPSSNAENELIFLHMIWRHGDRTPKWLCKNDPNNASTWVEGLGQLTPTGMEQQQRLGSLIFNEYAVKQKLISQRYESNQIYFRSTDVNRTLLSAVSNLVGMYFNRPEQIANLDYPSMKGWPNGYVPVAVHTLQTKYDHVG